MNDNIKNICEFWTLQQCEISITEEYDLEKVRKWIHLYIKSLLKNTVKREIIVEFVTRVFLTCFYVSQDKRKLRTLLRPLIHGVVTALIKNIGNKIYIKKTGKNQWLLLKFLLTSCKKNVRIFQLCDGDSATKMYLSQLGKSNRRALHCIRSIRNILEKYEKSLKEREAIESGENEKCEDKSDLKATCDEEKRRKSLELINILVARRNSAKKQGSNKAEDNQIDNLEQFEEDVENIVNRPTIEDTMRKENDENVCKEQNKNILQSNGDGSPNRLDIEREKGEEEDREKLSIKQANNTEDGESSMQVIESEKKEYFPESDESTENSGNSKEREWREIEMMEEAREELRKEERRLRTSVDLVLFNTREDTTESMRSRLWNLINWRT